MRQFPRSLLSAAVVLLFCGGCGDDEPKILAPDAGSAIYAQDAGPTDSSGDSAIDEQPGTSGSDAGAVRRLDLSRATPSADGAPSATDGGSSPGGTDAGIPMRDSQLSVDSLPADIAGADLEAQRPPDAVPQPDSTTTRPADSGRSSGCNPRSEIDSPECTLSRERIETLVNDGSGTINSVALVDRTLYWTEGKTVRRRSLRGGPTETFASVSSRARSAWSVASDGTWVYWSESHGSSNAQLFRRRASGGGIEELSSAGTIQRLMLLGDYLYFGLSRPDRSHSLARIPRNGGSLEILGDMGRLASNFATDGSGLYWVVDALGSAKQIRRYDLGSGRTRTLWQSNDTLRLATVGGGAVFVGRRTGGTSNPSRLIAVPTAGGQPRTIAEGFRNPPSLGAFHNGELFVAHGGNTASRVFRLRFDRQGDASVETLMLTGLQQDFLPLTNPGALLATDKRLYVGARSYLFSVEL